MENRYNEQLAALRNSITDYLITWNFRDTLILRILQFEKKSRNLSDTNNKCSEHNMTRKLIIMSVIKKECVFCLKFYKNKLATWYSTEIQEQVDSRVNFEDVNVELKLSVFEPYTVGI